MFVYLYECMGRNGRSVVSSAGWRVLAVVNTKELRLSADLQVNTVSLGSVGREACRDL